MFRRNLILSGLIGLGLVAGAASTSRAGGGDTTPPETTATVSPAPTAFGWHNDDVTVDLIAEDNDEVHSITYWATGADAFDPVEVSDDEASFDIVEEGVTVVHFFATDESDNDEEEQTITIRIDLTVPILRATVSPKSLWPPNGRTVNIAVRGIADDELSGVDLDSGEFEVIDEYNEVEPGGAFEMDDDGNFSFTVPLTASRLGRDRDGRTYTLRLSVLDKAGNVRVISSKIIVPHDMRGGGGRGGGNGRGGGGKDHGGGHGRGGGNGGGHGRGGGNGGGHGNR